MSRPAARSKIASYMFYMFYSITVLPLLVLAVTGYLDFSRTIEAQITSKLVAISDGRLNLLEDRIGALTAFATERASGPTPVAAFRELESAFYASGMDSKEYRLLDLQYRDPFQRYFDVNRNFSDLLFVSRNGDIIYSMARGSDDGKNLRVPALKGTGLALAVKRVDTFLSTSISSLNFYPPANKPVFFIGAPVYDKGVFLGTMAFRVEPDLMNEFASNYTGLPKSGEIVLGEKSADGFIITVPTRLDPTLAFNNSANKKINPSSPMLMALGGETGVGFAVDYRGKKVLARWSYIPELNWGMVVKVDVDDIFSSVHVFRDLYVAVLALIVFFMYWMLRTVTRNIAEPIEKIRDGLVRVGGGDLDHQIDIKRDDEIGELSDDINEMTRSLKDYHERLEELVEERTRELNKSRESLSVTLRSIGDGIIVTDTGQKITMMNAVAEKLTGWSAKEAVGARLMSIFRVINEETRQPCENPAEKAIKTGQAQGLSNHSLLIARDGTERPVDDSCAPILDEKHNIIGIVLVFRDISERRKLDRMKDDFVSMVSHELRTPLTVIQGILANFLDGILGEFSEKQKRSLVTMNDDVLRLSRIINDILNLSKLEAGGMEIHRSETDIEGLAKKCADELAGLAGEKKIWISVESGQKLPPLNIDPDKIAEVFINLINNAIKFTPEGGKITVRISGTKEQAEISVTDTGIGIEEDQIPRLFSKFFQVSRNQPPGQKGTGLGLAICREIIGLHGGKIWAKSEPGKGSVFTFTLPDVPGRRTG